MTDTRHLIFISILSLVILTQSIRIARAYDDDEFAEFDDLGPGESRPKPDRADHKPVDETLPIQEHIKSVDILRESQPLYEKPSKEAEPGSKEDETATHREKLSDEKLKATPKSKLVKPTNLWVYRWDAYYIELTFIFCFVLYFINFFVGSNRNNTLVQEWYDACYETLNANFSLIGGSPLMEVDRKLDPEESVKEKLAIQETYKNKKGFVKMTESSYTLWCSGRTGTDGVLIHFDLLRRHDLFMMAFNIVKPAQDSVVYHFLINNSDGYDNFVFCIANKTVASKLAKDMVDINVYCPKRKPISQCGVNSERLHVMSESSDITSYILDSGTSKFISEHEKAINYIHITDQYSIDRREEVPPALKLANPKRIAIFSYAIPSKTSEAGDYLEFSLNLLDRLRKFKLNRESKQKSEKMRQKIIGIQQKTALADAQQRAKETKDALRRQEKEMMINEEDPAKQRMWERKEAKRELKKNKMRVKQLKVKSI